MPTPKKTKPDATEMRAIVAGLRADQEVGGPEYLRPCCDMTLPLTRLESLALLRCRFQTNHGKDERGEEIKTDVRDLNEIRNLLEIVELATAPPDGDLTMWERGERAERVASSLVTAYIWARLKQSAQGGTSLDLRAMGATGSPEFRRVLIQLEREKSRREEMGD